MEQTYVFIWYLEFFIFTISLIRFYQMLIIITETLPLTSDLCAVCDGHARRTGRGYHLITLVISHLPVIPRSPNLRQVLHK